ncbi:hypothetical protein JCM10207_004636 [Rhodosporidiobolus poonsookiae]
MADSPLDYTGLLARQDVATAILAPYVAGLTTEVLLIGVYLALFAQYAHRELKLHRPAVKIVSWVVFGLVVCCLGISFEEIIDSAASQERSSDKMLAGPAQSNVLPILTGLTGAVCQGFLMMRAATLIPQRWIRYTFCGFVSCVILLGLSASALFSGIGFLFVVGADHLPLQYATAVAIWLWSSACADVSISIALAYTLHSRIAGFNPHTDSLLKRLIVVGLRTAAYTSLIAIVGAAVSTAFHASEDIHTSAVGFAFYAPLPALHAISLHTTLSTRRTITRELGNVALTAQYAPPATPFVGGGGGGTNSRAYRVGVDAAVGRNGTGSGQSKSGGRPIAVQVQKEEQVEYDDERDDFDEEFMREQRKGGRTREAAADYV